MQRKSQNIWRRCNKRALLGCFWKWQDNKFDVERWYCIYVLCKRQFDYGWEMLMVYSPLDPATDRSKAVLSGRLALFSIFLWYCVMNRIWMGNLMDGSFLWKVGYFVCFFVGWLVLRRLSTKILLYLKYVYCCFLRPTCC